jgi:hypothetical protein
MKHAILVGLLLATLPGCVGTEEASECPGPDCPGCPGPDCSPEDFGAADTATDYNENNLLAGSRVLYEVQVRSANACRTDTGADWQREDCRNRVAPEVTYRAEGMTCGSIDDLEAIRLGTLDDMLEDSTDYRDGITVRYIDERVGANTIWLMPLFPNNDTWNIPDACDNLGSPYAVRDYMHAAGSLSRRCILEGRDEHDDAQPCWGNQELDQVIAEAHRRGMMVILDVAFNHFGHNYQMYDYVDYDPVRERIATGTSSYEALQATLWDFEGTYEETLLHPELLDTVEELDAIAAANPWHAQNLEDMLERCPGLEGMDQVRAYNMWRVALDWERGLWGTSDFPCEDVYLEQAVPGFYLGSDHWSPSTRLGDNFSNDWRDVKFLYHQEGNRAHSQEFFRQREYLFRILNYWVSRGVDGFRLDHTTDYYGGMGSAEWDYILSKVDYYAWRRGQHRPMYLAEEFFDQMGMDRVVDVMTEGYVFDMNGRGGSTKDTAFVERVLGNMGRFPGQTYVMTALETHDEHRLMEGTGFNVWTGAGFWAIGASTRSTPMLLMGQEFGEPYGLGFRRSDFLRGRFEGTSNYNSQGQQLVDFYHNIITNRLASENRALLYPNQWFLRTRQNDGVDSRIFASARWSGDGNVMFVFHNLWEQDVAQSYYIPQELASQLWIGDSRRYRLFDVVSGRQMGGCRTGADLKWDFYVEMDAGTRMQWLRLEACD